MSRYQSAYASRNNVCNGNTQATKRLGLRADAVVDEAASNAVMHVIEWMQRHVDRYLATPPGTEEARIALNTWRNCW